MVGRNREAEVLATRVQRQYEIIVSLQAEIGQLTSELEAVEQKYERLQAQRAAVEPRILESRIKSHEETKQALRRALEERDRWAHRVRVLEARCREIAEILGLAR